MNFNFGNLVSAAVGAVSKVANAVVNALSPVAKGGGLFGGIADAVIGAAIAVANVCEDGEIDEDEIEEILANVVKVYVGATIAMFGSSSLGSNNDTDGNSVNPKLDMALGSVTVDMSKLGTSDVGNFKGLENPTLDDILSRIPSDGNNVGFNSEPGRIENGFKFHWKDPITGEEWTVWGHEPDPVAMKTHPESNAVNGWTYRIMNEKPTGKPYYWNYKTEEMQKDTRSGAVNKSNETHAPMQDPTIVNNKEVEDDDNDNDVNPPGAETGGDLPQVNTHEEGDKCVDDGGAEYEFRNGQWEKTGQYYSPFCGMLPINSSMGSIPTMPYIPIGIPEVIPIL